MCNTLKTFGMYSTNDQNTRQMACLDNIFVSSSVLANVHLDNTLSSDHCGLLAQMTVVSQKTSGERISYRTISDAGIYVLYNTIEQVNWKFIYDSELNVDFKTNEFIKILCDAIEYCFPTKTKLVFKNKPLVNWYTQELHSMREHLHLLNILNNKYPGIISANELRMYKSNYRSKLRDAKVSAFDNYIESSNCKSSSMWKIINHNIPRKTSNIDNAPTAEDFNNFFIKIPEDIIINLNNSTVNPLQYLSTYYQTNLL